MTLAPEDRRQLVHASMTGFALLLRFLTPMQAALMAGAAVALNWIVLPATGLDRSLRRDGGPWLDGVKLYPVAVLAAVLLFPLPTAAAAWGVMGLGDAASNVAGRRFGRPPFLGRRDRSFVGSAAMLVVGTGAAAALAAWTAGSPFDAPLLVASAAAAAAGVAAELLSPPRWDDNVAVCLAAGAAFHVAG